MPRLACLPIRHSATKATSSAKCKESPWKAKDLLAKSQECLVMGRKEDVTACGCRVLLAIGCHEKARVPITCLSAVGSHWRLHPLAEKHPQLSQRGSCLLSLRAMHHSCLSKRCLLVSQSLLKHVQHQVCVQSSYGLALQLQLLSSGLTSTSLCFQ